MGGSYNVPPQKSDNEKKPSVAIDILIAVCLFFTCLAPIGIILMWVYKVPRDIAIRIIATILFGGIFIFVIGFYGGENKGTSSNNTSTVSRQEVETEENTTEDQMDEVIETANNIVLGSDFSNLKMGEICNDGDLYIGLSYAKLSDTFTTALDSEEEIGSDKQVLFAYFDLYNAGSSKIYVDDSEFTCYVDGTSYSKVDTNFYYEEDGISNRFDSSLQPNTNKIQITNFEIPTEWDEIKLYYGSNCIWILSNDELTSEPYEFKSMYDIDYKQEATKEGDTIYSDKYEIVYDGYEYHTQDYTNDNLIIFKFTINNTGSSELDYSMVGYDMTLYANNYVMSGPDYGIDEKISDYSNVYNVDTIQAGMSSRIYVAFELTGEHDYYRMVYDAGYIAEDYLADVYVDEGANSNTGDESGDSFDFTITNGEVGEYGFEKTLNAGTDGEETKVCYHIPAGTYSVKNIGEYAGGINVYSDETHVTSEGWEEPAESGDGGQIQPGESMDITIGDGQYLEININGALGFIKKE